jgi:hypothetical protein
VAPEARGGLGSRRLHGAGCAARPDEEQAPVIGTPPGTEVRAERPELARPVGEREERAGLGEGRQAEHRQAGPRTGEVVGRLEPRGPAGHRPGIDPIRRGQRGRPQDDVGEEPEPALRPEDELAQVRAGGGGGERRQVERPGGRLEDAAREQLLDAADAQTPHPRAAGRDPAPDRRELERLRLVAHRQAVGGERLGEGWPGGPGARRHQAAPLVDGRHARDARQVDGDERVPRRTGVDPAHDARAAAVRDEAGAGRAGQVEDRADLGPVRRCRDRVRDRVEAAEPQVEEVGQRLATGMAHPCLRVRVEEVVRRHARRRHGAGDVLEGGERRGRGGPHLPLDERPGRAAEMRVDVLEPPAVPTPHRAIVPHPVARDAARSHRPLHPR